MATARRGKDARRGGERLSASLESARGEPHAAPTAPRAPMSRSAPESRLVRFLSTNDCFVSVQQCAEITHVLMNGERGGRVRIPDELIEQFFEAYAADLQTRVSLFVVERRSAVFKMHFDFDYKGQLDDVALSRVAETIHLTVADYYELGSASCSVANSLATAVACVSQRGGSRCSSNLHVIFPFLAVRQETALRLQALAVERCSRLCEGSLADVDFSTALDSCVLNGSGYRMLGSDKCKACSCREGGSWSRAICASCQGKGYLAEGKVYVPWRCFPSSSDDLLRLLQTNEAYAAKMCSIRLPRGAAPASVPRPPLRQSSLGALQARPGEPVRRQRGAPSGSSPYARGGLGAYERAQLPEEVSALILQEVRAYHSAYASLEVKSVLSVLSGETYLVKVKGAGSRFCLNKGSEHTSQCVYFVLSAAGLACKCYSRKAVQRLDGLCQDFIGHRQPLPQALRALFSGSPQCRPLFGDRG
jgi:hypothetical protein